MYTKKRERYIRGYPPPPPSFPRGCMGCFTWNKNRYRSLPRCYVWMGFSPSSPSYFPRNKTKRKRGITRKGFSLSFPFFPSFSPLIYIYNPLLLPI